MLLCDLQVIKAYYYAILLVTYLTISTNANRYKALNSSVPKIIKPPNRKNEVDSRLQDSRIGLFRIKNVKYLPISF